MYVKISILAKGKKQWVIPENIDTTPLIVLAFYKWIAKKQCPNVIKLVLADQVRLPRQ